MIHILSAGNPGAIEYEKIHREKSRGQVGDEPGRKRQHCKKKFASGGRLNDAPPFQICRSGVTAGWLTHA